MFVVRLLVTLVALFMVGTALWDLFETVVLPRRVSRRFRLTSMYFRGTWRVWSSGARHIISIRRREAILAVYGPLALLSLLMLWVVLLIVAYALLLWGLGSPLHIIAAPSGFGTDLYFSGTTLLTLGLGDVFPASSSARIISVVEVGTGFGVLALVIGYLPVLYQAFSRREVKISLLDAHAGSPPTAGALLSRQPPTRRARRLCGVLSDWESWSAELLETHLSYPLLGYYRSQHEDQSWVAGLTVILDTCTLVLACGQGLNLDEELSEQAAFTFAMARHAAVDLASVFRPDGNDHHIGDHRLPPEERARLHNLMTAAGVVKVGNGSGKVQGKLDDLRGLYEPYVEDLSAYLLMPLPPWVPPASVLDDWQTTPDGLIAPSVSTLSRHSLSSSVGL